MKSSKYLLGCLLFIHLVPSNAWGNPIEDEKFVTVTVQ